VGKICLRFRQISDISYALLCIVGRNCNERRLLDHIDQLLTVAFVATNQAVGGSTPSGRAIRKKVPIGAFFRIARPDEEENFSSIKRASVLEAAGET